ncbi:inositol monophosphatase, partial [Bacteroides thetaiotaomicron]
MVFHKKSYTFDVLFNNKDEMLDLKQLTVEVCRIATEAGHFLKEERKNFRRERVME